MVSSTGLSNIFAPETTPAQSIFDLSMFVLGITGLIFVVVAGLLVYAVVKFRSTPHNAHREPAQVYGSTQIELAWTVIPILIVVVLFFATARVIHAIQDAVKPANALDITVIGHQFWWEFRYPALGIVTANELHVPVSDPARPQPTFLKLLSADTDHSFWIPQLGGKTDLIPNHRNTMWMDPRRTGVFLGQCAQYCGTQHGKMLLSVTVDSAEDFDAWVRDQQTHAVQGETVLAGKRIFETTACINCHAIRANGRYGPDLTHLMSRKTLASGFQAKQCRNCHALGDSGGERGPSLDSVAVRLTQDQLIRQVIQGGGNMPAYGKNLNPAETTALVAFLQTLHPPGHTPAADASRGLVSEDGADRRPGGR